MPSLPEFMIFTMKLAHFVLVRSLLHDTICTCAVFVFSMVRFFDVHVDWANVVVLMMSRHCDGNRSRGGDNIDVPILLLFMIRSHGSLVLRLTLMMSLLVLLCVVRRMFYNLGGTVNGRLECSWLICRSSFGYLAQVKLLIRSVHMIRHSADKSMLVHGDWSIMHFIVVMIVLVVNTVPIDHMRIVYGPMLLLELFLGRSSLCLLVLFLLFLGWLGLSWLGWLLRGWLLLWLSLLRGLLRDRLWLSLLGLLFWLSMKVLLIRFWLGLSWLSWLLFGLSWL